MIAPELLTDSGAVTKHFLKGETLFSEGDAARYYFQVVSGEIKMNNYNDEGKEFIQGMFANGDSFGEPPLLLDKHYPASALALTDAEVFVLSKEAFFKLLQSQPETAIAIAKRLAERLYYKAVMASELASQDPEHRILKLIDYLKIDVGGHLASHKFPVTLTRQQLADLTGLRVETVIRSVKALEKKGALTIENRKVYR